MLNQVIQYVLSAQQRRLGFTIEEVDDNIVCLCYQGRRVWSTSPCALAMNFSIEAEKYQIEMGIY